MQILPLWGKGYFVADGTYAGRLRGAKKLCQSDSLLYKTS